MPKIERPWWYSQHKFAVPAPADQGQGVRQHRHALGASLRLPHQPVQLAPPHRVPPLVPVHRPPPPPARRVPLRRRPGPVHRTGIAAVQHSIRQPFVQTQGGRLAAVSRLKSTQRRPSASGATAVRIQQSSRFSPRRAPRQGHISSQAITAAGRRPAFPSVGCRLRSRSRLRAWRPLFHPPRHRRGRCTPNPPAGPQAAAFGIRPQGPLLDRRSGPTVSSAGRLAAPASPQRQPAGQRQIRPCASGWNRHGGSEHRGGRRGFAPWAHHPKPVWHSL